MSEILISLPQAECPDQLIFYKLLLMFTTATSKCNPRITLEPRLELCVCISIIIHYHDILHVV